MRLRFSAEARGHIAAIHNYVSQRNTVAAAKVVGRIRSAAERLAEFPRIGHVGRVPGTHEWVVRGLPYIIVYQRGMPQSDEVIILGVFHAAQNREQE